MTASPLKATIIAPTSRSPLAGAVGEHPCYHDSARYAQLTGLGLRQAQGLRQPRPDGLPGRPRIEDGAAPQEVVGVQIAQQEVGVGDGRLRPSGAVTGGTGLCPGDYDPPDGGVFGPEAIHFLQRFHADKAFIGASGLTSSGPVEANSPVSWIKRAMIGQTKRCLLMVDHTKFNAYALERVCPLSDIDDVIADTSPDETLAKALAVAKVDLHIAG